MNQSEVNRLAELDRRERVTEFYTLKNGELECHEVNWNVPQWNMQEKLAEWKPIAESYTNLWGAFQGDKLVGFSIYRRNLTEEMAQLALLHVSNGFRGKGIGKSLMLKTVEQAVKDGKKQLYVSSAPSKNTVDFYRRRGFELTDEPNIELFEMEPEDIHMIMLVSRHSIN